MPDMPGAVDLLGENDAADRVGTGFGETGGMEEVGVAFGYLAAGIVPILNVVELDLENCALESIEAGVPSDFVVVVALAHAVLAQHAGALGQLVGIGGDHAGIARGTEILGGIKAEGGDMAERAGFHAMALGTPGLGCVFDQLETVFLGEARQRHPRRRIGRRGERGGWRVCWRRAGSRGLPGRLPG